MYTRSFLAAFHAVGRSVVLPLPVLAGRAPRPVCSANLAVPLIKPSIVYKIKASDDRLEMIVHSSRILTMEQKISQTERWQSRFARVDRRCRPIKSRFPRKRRA